MSLAFQRARRPEQMAVRRAAILDVARAMLSEKSVAEISLRELSDRVGLAKSNVLRYFDSREAIFLEVLLAECESWLVGLEAVLGKPRARRSGYANEIRVATAIADTLAAAPLLCELVGTMAGVLERNISVDTARDFKARVIDGTAMLARLIARQLPWLPPEAAALYAEGVVMLAAGMYPFSNPTDPVRVAIAELDMPDPRQRFVDGLREALISWLIGAAVRSED